MIIKLPMLPHGIVHPGEITEIVGRPSSGRTSLFAECVRVVTGRGATVAIVDTDGALDPGAMARAGVDLGRVLWVRCEGHRQVALRALVLLVRCPGFGLVGLDVGELVPRLSLAAAFRLRLAVRRSGAALVIVAGRRIAGAGASLAIETIRRAVDWSGPGPVPTRLAGMRTEFRVLRARGPWSPGGRKERWWAV